MSVQLPQEYEPMLAEMRREWPRADEDQLSRMAAIYESCAILLRKELEAMTPLAYRLADYTTDATHKLLVQWSHEGGLENSLEVHAKAADLMRSEFANLATSVDMLKRNYLTQLKALTEALSELESRVLNANPQPSPEDVKAVRDKLYARAAEGLDAADKSVMNSLQDQDTKL